jgi:hypothetical protein
MNNNFKAVIIGICAGAASAYAITYPLEQRAIERLAEAYDQGKKDALRRNPASDELEMTCLGMWLETRPVPTEK